MTHTEQTEEVAAPQEVAKPTMNLIKGDWAHNREEFARVLRSGYYEQKTGSGWLPDYPKRGCVQTVFMLASGLPTDRGHGHGYGYDYTTAMKWLGLNDSRDLWGPNDAGKTFPEIAEMLPGMPYPVPMPSAEAQTVVDMSVGVHDPI